MADATDLKSVDRKVVRVRLPPSAPTSSLVATALCVMFETIILLLRLPNEGKMRDPSTRLAFELDHFARWLWEFSDRVF